MIAGTQEIGSKCTVSMQWASRYVFKTEDSKTCSCLRSGPVLAKRLASSSSTWWCSVGQPVSWALWEPAWPAAFAASAAKPSLMTRR